MSSIKSTSRRTFGLAVAGVAFALATAGLSHAEDVRTIKIATAAESSRSPGVRSASSRRVTSPTS